jgi:trk system potassium uptake protein TrkH
MNLFDAMCHAFGAIASGGFSTKNSSITFFQSHYINWVIIFSMISAGTNFFLHYNALRGRPFIYFKDPEFKFWISYLILAILLIILINLWHNPQLEAKNFSQNLRVLGKVVEESTFMAVSLSSTTGFGLADYDKWNYAAQFILVVLMIFGSCAGSTCGAIKIMRLMVLFKATRLEVRRMIHPHAIMQVRLGEKPVSSDIVRAIFMFVVAYFGMVGIGIFILMFLGLDWASAIGGVVACAGGVGPGLGVTGPTTTYYVLPAVSKLTLCWEMLMGRFEIYAFIVVFSRGFWRA